MTTPANRSGYAPVAGGEVYYAVYGEGDPLVLLHGGLMTHETFGPTLARLAEGHQVIGIDLQGHGRTLPLDRPMSRHRLHRRRVTKRAGAGGQQVGRTGRCRGLVACTG
jgi:pimeloyl-ACP methyl ester carboxylesterase